MPKKTEADTTPVDVRELVEIRYPNGKTEEVNSTVADLLCRKEGCVDVAKEKAEKEAAEEAAKKAAEEEAKKEK